MEGTMDSRRLVLTRPTPRSVAPRRLNTVSKKEVVSVETVKSSAGPSVLAQSAQPQFSKLTPIYKPSPVNTVADISRPRVKGIEFIKVSTKPEAVKSPIESAMVSTAKDNLPLVEMADPSVGPNLEFYKNNIDSIDFDLIEGNLYDNESVAVGSSLVAEATDYQPINFVEQYFQRSVNKPVSEHRRKNLLPMVKQNIKKVNNKHVRRLGVLSVLMGVIAFGGYLVTDSFFVNQEAKAVIDQNIPVATSPVLTETASSATSSQADTTAQTTQAAPQVSTTASNAAGYTVAPDQPKFISIQKLGIHAPVVNVGLTAGGAVDTPKNIWNAAWYNGSAKPGNPGAVLIDGHSSATRGALFGNLDRLVAGDQIQVERGDGTVITYSVAYSTIVNRNNVDMASMLKPYDGSDKGLNIITCTGKWIDSEKTLENRVLIYAKQI